MEERQGAILMKGNPLTLLGKEVKVNEAAPDFDVVGVDLSSSKLSSFKGKTVVISSVPSLDTPVCDTQTRRFNEEATKWAEDVIVLTISMDLPFAQARWCGAAGVERVKTFSDHKEASFGSNWGMLIKELRLLARGIFIVDKEGILRYSQLVKETSSEPNYEDALKAIKEVTAK